MTDDARQEFDEQAQNVQDKREKFEKRLQELQAATDENWERLKTGVQNAWEELQKAFDDRVRIADSDESSANSAADK